MSSQQLYYPFHPPTWSRQLGRRCHRLVVAVEAIAAAAMREDDYDEFLVCVPHLISSHRRRLSLGFVCSLPELQLQPPTR